MARKDAAASLDDDALLNSNQVREFFGNVSAISLWRWLKTKELGFPRPIKIASRNYWIRRELVAFRDRQRARACADSAVKHVRAPQTPASNG